MDKLINILNPTETYSWRTYKRTKHKGLLDLWAEYVSDKKPLLRALPTVMIILIKDLRLLKKKLKKCFLKLNNTLNKLYIIIEKFNTEKIA